MHLPDPPSGTTTGRIPPRCPDRAPTHPAVAGAASGCVACMTTPFFCALTVTPGTPVCTYPAIAAGDDGTSMKFGTGVIEPNKAVTSSLSCVT